jgi:hypothetical protein
MNLETLLDTYHHALQGFLYLHVLVAGGGGGEGYPMWAAGGGKDYVPENFTRVRYRA